ncbi:hypothetical protein [Paraburkholderia aromaticivorans]|uniref:hypothetical protein n=1 Tax=Paraburkholderia aromaticivorans TaxID=2026199 RepID=UPI001455F50A|nr:hypothetical protein [Paraburkholderia aromaticivorans]
MEESNDSKQFRETAIAIGGFVLGIVLAAAFTHIPGSPSEWATWVQAIGTIVALGVAIYFPLSQRRQSDKEAAAQRLERAKQQMYEIERIAYKILRDTLRLLTQFNPRQPVQLDVSAQREALAAIAQAEKTEFSEYRRTVLRAMRAHVEDIADYFGSPQTPPNIEWWNPQQSKWIRAPDKLMEQVRQVGARVAGGDPD